MDWSAKTAAAIILGIGRQLFDSIKCTRRKQSWIIQSEGPQQAVWMGQQDLHEVQQTHIPCGAPGEEQPRVSGLAGDSWLGVLGLQQRAWGPAGQADRESAV